MLKQDSWDAFNGAFASVFNANDRPWAARSPELEDHDCGNSDFQFADTDIARAVLLAGVCESMRPDETNPGVFKESAKCSEHAP